MWVMLFSVEKERKTKNPGHWRGLVSVCFCVGGCLCVCVFLGMHVCECLCPKALCAFFFFFDGLSLCCHSTCHTHTHTHAVNASQLVCYTWEDISLKISFDLKNTEKIILKTWVIQQTMSLDLAFLSIHNVPSIQNVPKRLVNHLLMFLTSTAKPDHTPSHASSHHWLCKEGSLLSLSFLACSCWPTCQFPGIKPSEMTPPHATKCSLPRPAPFIQKAVM